VAPCTVVNLPDYTTSYPKKPILTALKTSNVAVIRIMKWRVNYAWRMVRTGEMINVYNVLIGKPEGKSQFGRPSHRVEGSIKIILKEIWG
jgi:hypothetical protein